MGRKKLLTGRNLWKNQGEAETGQKTHYEIFAKPRVFTLIGSNSRNEQKKLAKQEINHIMATFWLNP